MFECAFLRVDINFTEKMSTEYIYDDWIESEYIKKISFKILGKIDIDSEYEYEEIGELTGYLISLTNVKDPESKQLFFEEVDEASEETLTLYNDFLKHIISKKKYSIENVFYIHNFFIERKYRSKGYGHEILNQLEDAFQYIFNQTVDYFFLIPNPIEKNQDGGIEYLIHKKEYKEEALKLKDKLIKFYSINGFNQYKTESEFYMKKLAN